MHSEGTVLRVRLNVQNRMRENSKNAKAIPKYLNEEVALEEKNRLSSFLQLHFFVV